MTVKAMDVSEWHEKAVNARSLILTKFEILVGDETAWNCSSGCSIVIENSQTSITGPTEAVAAIRSKTGANRKGKVDCDVSKYPTITFVIEGHLYSVEGSSLLTQEKTLFWTTCYDGFATKVNTTEFVVGETFLQNYYTIFDVTNRQLGFAELR